MMDDSDADVCRVCRMEGSKQRPLFHPCHCSGSIRYVHQECLIEWLRVSKKVSKNKARVPVLQALEP